MSSLSHQPLLLALAVCVAVMPGAFSAKPDRQLTITLGDMEYQLQLLLGGLRLQVDQTDDPSHAETITSTYTVCDAPADCHQECGAHSTPNFVKFGGAAKDLLRKNCTAPTDSCPRCTLGTRTPVLDDVDVSALVPRPIFTKEFA